MPIYEYRCEKCGDFEHTQRITEAPLQRCPACRRKVRRLISTTSFQLKGSGWYITDYARAGKTSESGKKEGASDTATAPAEGAVSDAGASSDGAAAKSGTSEAAKPAAGKPARGKTDRGTRASA
jgi:putative FmdB family regulatory protein